MQYMIIKSKSISTLDACIGFYGIRGAQTQETWNPARKYSQDTDMFLLVEGNCSKPPLTNNTL